MACTWQTPCIPDEQDERRAQVYKAYGQTQEVSYNAKDEVEYEDAAPAVTG